MGTVKKANWNVRGEKGVTHLSIHFGAQQRTKKKLRTWKPFILYPYFQSSINPTNLSSPQAKLHKSRATKASFHISHKSPTPLFQKQTQAPAPLLQKLAKKPPVDPSVEWCSPWFWHLRELTQKASPHRRCPQPWRRSWDWWSPHYKRFDFED